MYILKNAITSIKRNKGRNLLIGLIIMVISVAVTVTLAINNTATSLIKAYKDNKCIIIVTHSENVRNQADKVVWLYSKNFKKIDFFGVNVIVSYGG